MWENVKIHPWIGTEYENPTIFLCKTLILGDATYSTDDKYYEKFIITRIEKHIIENTDPRFSQLSPQIRSIIFGQNSEVSASTFWNNIAYYDFGQYSTERSNKAQLITVIWAFDEIIRELKPKEILVLGEKNWNRLLTYKKHKIINDHQVSFNINTLDIIAKYIEDPSI